MQGLKGDKGDAGATNLTVREDTVQLAAGETNGAFVNCHTGERATGGGVVFGATSDMVVTASSPNPSPGTPTSWYGEGHNGTASTQTMFIDVVCAVP